MANFAVDERKHPLNSQCASDAAAAAEAIHIALNICRDDARYH